MHLPPNSTEARRMACSHINGLSQDRAWTMVVAPYKKKRSQSQNNYYWGVIVAALSEATGMDGPKVHELLLGTCFGAEVKDFYGRKVAIPVRRSSDMTTTEFSNYVEWCWSFAAREGGLIIPSPNEVIT